jgi:hypothetical protein
VTRAKREPGWVARRVLTGWVALTLVAFSLPFLPGSDGLAGIYVLMLALPWSLAVSALIDSIDPELSDGPLGMGSILVEALFNGVLLFLFVRWIERRRASRP